MRPNERDIAGSLADAVVEDLQRWKTAGGAVGKLVLGKLLECLPLVENRVEMN